MHKRKITIKDIAQSLGVSIATVSRAINNKPEISLQLKTRVLNKVKELNYRPNLMAKSFRKKSYYNLIGVIVPELEHHFFSQIIKGVSSELGSSEMLLLGNSNYDPQKEYELILQFIEQGVAGIIMSPSLSFDWESINSTLPDIPFIFVDRCPATVESNFFGFDDLQGGRLAAEHLLQQQYKRFIAVAGPSHCIISSKRIDGFIDSLRRYGIQEKNYQIVHSDYIHLDALKDDLPNPATYDKSYPTGIFCITDRIAIEVMNKLKSNELTIPDDVGIVGFSNSLLSSYTSPTLSSIDQNSKLLGQKSVQRIYDLLQDNNTDQEINILDTSLVIRASSTRS